jgi:para-nitrobenzyl esterase
MTTLGVGKGQVRELQSMPLNRIMSAYFQVVRRMNVDQMTQGFSPLVDGTFIPQHPFHPVASNVSADVPLMLGSTRTELTSSAQPEDFELTDAAMRSRIRGLIGEHASNAIEVYQKANPGASASDLYFLIASDHRYSGPVMKIAERRAALGKGPVYLYYFRWETPADGGRLKSPHTIEIPFAFDNVKAATRLTGGGPEAMALADRVSDAWIAFARTGNPNTPKLPRWAPFNATDRPTMVIDNESKLVNDPIREQRLVMFKAHGYA